jgi:hypothetical protein
LPEEFVKKLDSQVRILDLMVVLVMLLSMYTLRMPTLLHQSMRIKMKKIWVLEIKDSCLDMLLTNGTLNYYIHTPMFFQIKSAKKWQRKERMVESHG